VRIGLEFLSLNELQRAFEAFTEVLSSSSSSSSVLLSSLELSDTKDYEP